MLDAAPTFPPLITGHRLPAGASPRQWAIDGAASGSLGAGDLGWAPDSTDLRFALVLEPDVPRTRCAEMLHTAMVSIGDAIGALAPPELSVTYRWPQTILLNEASAGTCGLTLAPGAAPHWLALSTRLAILPPEPGHHADRTSLWDEGCTGLTPATLLESIARHLVARIHTWSEDGFAPIHSDWWGRRSSTQPLDPAFDGSLTGLDEHGGALIAHAGRTTLLSTLDALETLDGRAP